MSSTMLLLIIEINVNENMINNFIENYFLSVEYPGSSDFPNIFQVVDISYRY